MISFGAVSYGAVLTRDRARPILQHFGIKRDTDIGPEGIEVQYQGEIYWILQYEVTFPEITENSPDGRHIVYGPSEEEQVMGPKIPEESPIQSIIKLGGLAVIAYLVVNVLGFFKRK